MSMHVCVPSEQPVCASVLCNGDADDDAAAVDDDGADDDDDDDAYADYAGG